MRGFWALGIAAAATLSGCETLDASRRNVSYGLVLVGTRKGPETVTFTNTDAPVLNVSDVPMAGADATAFSRAITPAVPANLAKDQRVTVDYTFAPTAARRFVATSTPTVNNAPAGTTIDTVNLDGEGVNQISEGELTVGEGALVNPIANGTPLDFGAVRVPGGAPVTRTFKVRNRHRLSPLRVTVTITPNNQGFTMTVPALMTFTLAPRQKLDVTIQFAPPAIGNFNASVTFSGVDPNNRTVTGYAGTTLTGRGVE
ncbi:MAG TPA: choice-of-anchor D domain-containing protein [Planctomycetota bacterium]|nr:choice-of-anchor D domain-containing protein [Planctomycetota bacterium]